jgi:predicted ATP-grasp superfamily ATP-dependent carboligase
VNTSTPAVVLVCHRQAGVGIVRSLGRLGVPVYGIDKFRGAPALWSRYCSGEFIWDLHGSAAQDSVRVLLEAGRQIGRRSILIPTSDIAAMFVADQAEPLSEWFIFARQPPALVRSLCSKKGMYFVAKECGLDTPETTFPRTRAEVIEYLERARFPVLLKPIFNRVAAGAAGQWRMVLVHDRRALLEHYDKIEEPSNVMLQEYIPGGDEMTWTFNGYFDENADCLLAFSGRKLRNFPPYFGQASLAVCTRNQHVENLTIGFMKSLGYAGPLDLGFRYDARDGRYKVNDVNPRIGAMFRLFAGHNGIDVVRALYQHLTGQAVVPTPAQEGRKWLVEDVDPLSALRYYRDGNLTIRNWINSLRHVQEMAFFARDDPLPLLGAYLMDIREALRRKEPSRNARREGEALDPRTIADAREEAADAASAATAANFRPPG